MTLRLFRTLRSGPCAHIAAIAISLFAANAHAQDGDPPPPPIPEVGMKAPILSIESIIRQGRLPSTHVAEVEPASLRGKVVVLEFWATWCAPCIGAIPHLNDLVAHHADDPVVFISITDETADEVEPFLKKRPIDGAVALDNDRSIFHNFRIGAIPRTFLIDQDGIIRAIVQPSGLTSTMIDAVLQGRDPLAPAAQPQQAVEFTQQPATTARPLTIVVEGDAPSSSAAIAAPNGGVLYEISLRRSFEIAPRIDSADDAIVASGCTARDLLAAALEASPGHITSDGDSLIDLDSTRYDAVIRIPPGPGADPTSHRSRLRARLASTLQDGLGIWSAQELRIVPVAVLRGQGGTRLRDVSGQSGASSLSWGMGTISAIRQPISVLVQRLSAMTKMPVTDETGLTGMYDWTVRCGDESLDGASAAVREQLGLEVDVQTRQLPMHVVRRRL
jgi:uncharacterized protein (TIGR03435 family)